MEKIDVGGSLIYGLENCNGIFEVFGNFELRWSTGFLDLNGLQCLVFLSVLIWKFEFRLVDVVHFAFFCTSANFSTCLQGA
jgi:hypothetical protein